MTSNIIKNNFFKKLQTKISVLFFDMDNTLIQTRTADSRACHKISTILQERYGFTNDAANYTTKLYLTTFRRCPDNPDVPLDLWRQHLWSEALPDTHKTLANSIYEKWLDLRYRYLALTPEIVDLLQSLRKNYLLAIITNGPSNAQWEKIEKLNFTKLFDYILVSGDLPWEKPNIEIFLSGCNYLGVQPENCIMIGDKLETDIQGGIDAKLGATIWIPLANEKKVSKCNTDDLMKMSTTIVVDEPCPDYTIGKLEDLKALLLSTSGTGSINIGGNDVGAVNDINGNTNNVRKNSNSRSKSFSNSRGCPYYRRIASLPDFDSGNSNSSSDSGFCS